MAALRETVDLLRRQLDGQAALVEDVRTDRDHWRAQAEALPRLLVPPRTKILVAQSCLNRGVCGNLVPLGSEIL